MGHDHTHGTLGKGHSHARRLGLALALVLAYVGIEVVGGLLSGLVCCHRWAISVTQ